MRYSMMQLQRDADGGHTCHVTIRSGDTRRPPVMRHYRNVTPSSVCRFFELSGGYFTAYSQREERGTGQ